MAVRTVGFNLLKLREATPDLPDADGSIELDRLGRGGPWIQGPFDVRVPDSDIEIEVVLSSLLCAGELGAPLDLRLIADPRIFVDPVQLPGFSAVRGKSLFGLGGVGAHPPNGESDQDEFSVDLLLIVEVATAVLELTDAGNSQGADIGSGEIQVPLPGRRIVPTQGQEFDVAGPDPQPCTRPG